MMDWSPRCYIPSCMKIGPPVLEKKIFEVFFTIYGHGGHLGHVTRIMLTNFQKFGLNFCMYTTLGQGQEMTLTFNTHITS